MSANRIQIKASTNDKKVTIPIGQGFDGLGREQLISIWEEVEQQDNINLPQDYETTTYSHENPNDDYKMFYRFRFWDAGSGIYVDNYNALGFSNRELAKSKQSFVSSFYKLDFFDSPHRSRQKILFTMIIPANNSLKDYGVPVSSIDDPIEYFTQVGSGAIPPNVFYTEGVYEPQMELGPNIGNNEGYFIQWLKERNLFELDTFYVGCKFFNAKTGKIIRMVNKQQTTLSQQSGVYDYLDWFYYQLVLDIKTSSSLPKYSYKFRQFNRFLFNNEMVGSQVGTSSMKLNFYEYINP